MLRRPVTAHAPALSLALDVHFPRHMGRALRGSIPAHLHHVMNRGNNREDLFRDAADFSAFLTQLAASGAHHGLSVLSYCLMPNHFHLLVDGDITSISNGMRDLTGIYARRFHRRYATRGHVFGGRFRAVPVVDDRQVAAVVRYVEMNPVTAGLCASPADWPWSSCAALLGQRPVHPCLAPGRLWALLGRDAQSGRAFLQGLVEPMTPVPGT